MQTSTVTVAVLDPEAPSGITLDPNDVDISTTRGSGPGGQHRNKTDSCVIATHKPSGLTVRIDMRSQHQSRSMALKVLQAQLAELSRNRVQHDRNDARRQQVGTGMRGDKIRTYREQDDRVTDHRTGNTWSFKKWSRGDW